MNTDRYRTTRAAWKRIWGEEGILARELQTLRYARAQRARSLYLPYLPVGEPILEAGCGVGAQQAQLVQLGYATIGLDYAENALVQLHTSFPEHRLTAGDIHRLPFRSEVFGAYVSFGVLEHFDFGPGPALKEACRVLRPGGIVVVAVPYPNLVWRLRQAKERFMGPGEPAESRYFETAYTIQRMEKGLRQSGFAILARHPIGHSFTLWGLGASFRGPGYYETSPLADRLGAWLERWMPWSMCFESLLIARRFETP